jgi:small subunit ribosomal protein S1
MAIAGPNGDDRNEDAMDMAALLAAEELSVQSLRRGEVIEGTVVGRDRDGVIVNVGAKSEGVIHPNEMQSLGHNPADKLAEGDRILVYIIHPETSEGQVLLSIDRARGETGWRELQTRFEAQTSFTVEIIGFNKGGLLCNVEGVNAFIPLSQLTNLRQDTEAALAAAVGKSMPVKVIELNRRRNRVILSERAAAQEWRSQQKDKLLGELEEGQIRTGVITSIRDFGVFVDLGGADGLAHLSELSWERDRSPHDLYRVGQEVEAFIMKVDPETKKIALSLRRAQPQQWDGLVGQYSVGQLVTGRITKLVPFGAFAQIEGQLEGLVHVSEISERKIGHPNEVVSEGDVLPLKIVRIERDRHRLALSLKQARNEAEIRGFVFDGNGAVTLVPEEEQERLAAEGIVTPPRQRGALASADSDGQEAEEPELSTATASDDSPVEAPAAAEEGELTDAAQAEEEESPVEDKSAGEAGAPEDTDAEPLPTEA